MLCPQNYKCVTHSLRVSAPRHNLKGRALITFSIEKGRHMDRIMNHQLRCEQACLILRPAASNAPQVLPGQWGQRGMLMAARTCHPIGRGLGLLSTREGASHIVNDFMAIPDLEIIKAPRQTDHVAGPRHLQEQRTGQLPPSPTQEASESGPGLGMSSLPLEPPDKEINTGSPGPLLDGQQSW